MSILQAWQVNASFKFSKNKTADIDKSFFSSLKPTINKRQMQEYLNTLNSNQTLKKKMLYFFKNRLIFKTEKEKYGIQYYYFANKYYFLFIKFLLFLRFIFQKNICYMKTKRNLLYLKSENCKNWIFVVFYLKCCFCHPKHRRMCFIYLVVYIGALWF